MNITDVRVRKVAKAEECAVCEQCLEMCPEEAIIKKAFKVEITEDKCTFCYNCLDCCPVGAIYEED